VTHLLSSEKGTEVRKELLGPHTEERSLHDSWFVSKFGINNFQYNNKETLKIDKIKYNKYRIKQFIHELKLKYKLRELISDLIRGRWIEWFSVSIKNRNGQRMGTSSNRQTIRNIISTDEQLLIE